MHCADCKGAVAPARKSNPASLEDKVYRVGSPKEESKQKIAVPVAKRTGLVELKESFGLDDNKILSIVPYHHTMRREISYKKINTAVQRTGLFPNHRIFPVSQDAAEHISHH